MLLWRWIRFVDVMRRLEVANTLWIGLIHILALSAALPLLDYFNQSFSWSGVVVCFVIGGFVSIFGINICYHRLLTHRSFKTPKWFEHVLTIIATTNGQGGPAMWVGGHRIHHQHSDQDGDPHSPTHGFTWAHIFWVLIRSPEGRDPKLAARDLLRNPITRLIDRYFWVPQFLVIPLLFGLGWWYGDVNTGVSWIVWGVGVRTAMIYHFTWFVNSACHTWGYRNFETTDNSTNNWWVALVSWGEGWHNNHHHDQGSAAHGMRWYEFDLTYWTIRALANVGLAWDIKKPKDLPT